MTRHDASPAPELHPLPPFLPAGARLLMLGSFPPARERWSMEFFYPNWQNDMWRIMGLVFFGDRDRFVLEGRKAFCRERIERFLAERGIALGDTVAEAVRERGNASDQFLKVARPFDAASLLERIPDCRTLVTTGQKATDTLLSLLPGTAEPPVGGFSPFLWHGRSMRLYRMPSSSRAYPKPLAEKTAVYETMFRETGLLP
ncbi:uracil-DNA glycosylase family protein [Gallalistipes aquisgranensis]|uniref:uracil-DNA glycosylase family protein n=1 Tax=Gallalistipes aquisgranensis TaxID=2779358 RepID=UPI001CF8CFDF|nr:uracil-DNA glycosylase family protein [Gallalistipes aquisgranensis]MBE5033472.1 uracil-DNA glycosylase family protein [Gallalistipes aquisgranensis]